MDTRKGVGGYHVVQRGHVGDSCCIFYNPLLGRFIHVMKRKEHQKMGRSSDHNSTILREHCNLKQSYTLLSLSWNGVTFFGVPCKRRYIYLVSAFLKKKKKSSLKEFSFIVCHPLIKPGAFCSQNLLFTMEP